MSSFYIWRIALTLSSCMIFFTFACEWRALFSSLVWFSLCSHWCKTCNLINSLWWCHLWISFANLTLYPNDHYKLHMSSHEIGSRIVDKLRLSPNGIRNDTHRESPAVTVCPKRRRKRRGSEKRKPNDTFGNTWRHFGQFNCIWYAMAIARECLLSRKTARKCKHIKEHQDIYFIIPCVPSAVLWMKRSLCENTVKCTKIY